MVRSEILILNNVPILSSALVTLQPTAILFAAQARPNLELNFITNQTLEV